MPKSEHWGDALARKMEFVEELITINGVGKHSHECAWISIVSPANYQHLYPTMRKDHSIPSIENSALRQRSDHESLERRRMNC
jgi:hypothetical protein